MHYVSYSYGLKQGDALSPLLFISTLGRFKETNGTRQLLGCDMKLLGDTIDTVKENRERLMDDSKVAGLEVNREKSKYE
jgi:hypothetical protein